MRPTYQQGFNQTSGDHGRMGELDSSMALYPLIQDLSSLVTPSTPAVFRVHLFPRDRARMTPRKEKRLMNKKSTVRVARKDCRPSACSAYRNLLWSVNYASLSANDDSRRPHSTDFRPRASTFTRLAQRHSTPGHTRAQVAQVTNIPNHNCHRLNNAHHHSLQSCHRHRPWSACAVRASVTPTLSR